MGTLYLVSTPIGNLEDITVRAIRILLTVPVILCEDTRRTGLLLSELRKKYADREIPRPPIPIPQPPRLMRFDEQTEFRTIPESIGILESGVDVALVSDAGTPLISDPGYLLVKSCRDRNIPVCSVPGPSAFVAAATVSGLPIHNLCFIGYLPDKSSHRITKLQRVKSQSEIEPFTVAIYCAPHKMTGTLRDLGDVFGPDQEVVIVRELTKIHEDVTPSTLQELLDTPIIWKGEIVIVLPLGNR